jgi:PTS system nitrogen regulatory IIA component
MNIKSILVPQRTYCNIESRSKKGAIETAAFSIAEQLPEVEAAAIYDSLIAREKLGPTALGHGVALPHCRLASCPTITGSLFTLKSPIDFGALDDLPVNIMFVLLVPEHEVDEHLRVMAMLAGIFDQSGFRQKLLSAQTDSELFTFATDGSFSP